MVFSSLFFVFFFLVLCYGLYLWMPSLRARNALLLCCSLVFYAWGGPPFVLLLCLETFVCFIGANLIASEAPPTDAEGGTGARGGGRFYLVLTVGLCLSFLVLFKYAGFLSDTAVALFRLDRGLPRVMLPIGISFYTFQLISYVADVYRREIPPQRNYLKLLLYASLFHQCIAGPIVRYADVAAELDHRRVTLEDAWSGLSRFTIGLAKKAVLADTCASVADPLLSRAMLEAGRVSSLSAFLGVTAYMLQIYLDFSAYSDMAIGMGRMIGFRFLENFRYPYAAVSVTDFWRRWHISLSSFFRDYVYIPLGGNRCSPARRVLNLVVVWTLTGLWHGAAWNFVLWGAYFAVLLILEKYVFRIRPARTPLARGFGRLYTLLAVWFGWILFRSDRLSDVGLTLKALAGFGNGFVDPAFRAALTGRLFILVVSVIACAPIVPWLRDRLAVCADSRRSALRLTARAVSGTAAAAGPALLLVLSFLSLVGNRYIPFLYFRF